MARSSGAQERFAAARRRKALDTFNVPATIKDLESALGVNYHTARRITIELLDLGQIKPNGNMRERHILYIRSSKGNMMPSIYNQYGDTHFDLIDYLKGMKDAGFPATSSEVAARSFLTTVLELMHLCSVVKEHGSVETERLEELHNQVINNIALLKSTTNMLQQLAEYEIFWSNEGLKRIASSNGFDNVLISNIYATYLKQFTESPTE
ncbi:MAG TPA: hypothetical protein VFK94_02845 [Patescibacteria group bacterium]|nr:hypothetical protein [Patescibacteria group bacterium]